jgi:hypothetical protein
MEILYLEGTPSDAFLNNTFSGWGYCGGIRAGDETDLLQELCEAQMAVGIEGSCFAAGCDVGMCRSCPSQSSCRNNAWCSWGEDGEDTWRCSDQLRTPDNINFYECARFCSVEVERGTVPCVETEEDHELLKSRSSGVSTWVGYMRAEQDGDFIWVDDS